MNYDLSTLTVEVNAESGIRNLDRYDASAGRANKSTTLLDGALGKLAAAFSALVIIRKFADETTGAQAAQAQLEAAIKSTGGAAGRSVKDLQEMAAKLQQLSTYSDDAVQGAQAILLTFQQIKGDTFDDATRAVVDLSTRMGGDLKSAALQVGKALQSPTEGLTALRRSGVSFTDAQADVIKKLVETNRLADAQKLILAELTTEFGGSAAAARNTLGGALTALSNAFGDLFEVSSQSTSGIVASLNAITASLSDINGPAAVAFREINNLILAVGTVSKVFGEWGKQIDIIGEQITGFNQALSGLTNLDFEAYRRGLAKNQEATDRYGQSVTRVNQLLANGRDAERASRSAPLSANGASYLRELHGGGASGGIGPRAAASGGASGPLGLFSGLTVQSAQATAAAVSTVNKEVDKLAVSYAKATRGLTTQLALQSAQNVAFGQSDDALAELNAEFETNAKIAAIAAQFTGAQATALIALTKELSAAQKVSRELANADRDRAIIAQTLASLAEARAETARKEAAALKEVTDIVAANTQRREAAADSAAREIELVERQIKLHGKSATEVQKLTDQYLLLDKAKEYQDAGLDVLSANAAAKAFVAQSAALRVLTEGTFKWGTALESVNGSLLLLTQSLGGAAGAAVRNIAAVSSALQLLIKAQESAKKNAGKDSTTSQQIGGGIGAAFAGFQAGSAFGSTTTSRTVGTIGGALSGAATGATIGASLGPMGALIGAGIGALAGAAGGFLASSKKAREEAERLVEVQKQLAAQFASIRASLSNDALGGAILQAQAQFNELRKSIESGLGGRKNEAARNTALAEANALEAQRIAQLQQEYAETQKKLQLDQTIRGLVANGRVAEAEALTFAAQQAEKYAALMKSGADATTLALEAETQLAEARKRAADLAEAERRRTFDLNNGTRAFTDPRGASQAAFDEAAMQRYADAIARGASAAELAAISAYNLAAAIDRAIQVQEADTRTRESLIGRGLGAQGNTRGQQDVAFAAAQRQEMVDAIRSGMSESNKALLKFVQFAERSQRQMQQAIEDGTKIIREAAEKQIAAIDLQISTEKARSAAEQARLDGEIQRVKDTAAATVAALDLQITGIESVRDAQVKALDVQKELLSAQLATQRDQLKTAEDALSVAQNAYQALSAFSQSLNLSDQSTATPVQRLADASGQFEALQALAAGGDAGAAAKLPEAARAFLEASKNVNASGSGFQQDFARVQSVVATLAEKFGKETSAASAQVAAMRSMVTASEAQLALIEKTRSGIAEAAALSISVLKDLKTATAGDAQGQVDRLEKLKEADKTLSDALLTRLGLDRLAVETEAKRQIDQLVKVEKEAHDARLAQNYYWDAYLRILQESGVGSGTASFTGTADTPDIMRVELVNVAPDPVAVATRDQTRQTVEELQAMIRVLQASSKEQKEQIDLLLAETRANNQINKRGFEQLAGALSSGGGF